MQRQDPVVILQRGGHADRDGLLADARKPFRQRALPEQAKHFFFDQARQQQRAIERLDVGCGNHATASIVLYSRREIDPDGRGDGDRRVNRLCCAQPAERIAVMLDARTEGRATRDEAATRLLDGVRRGLEALADVDVVPRELARRTIWIVTGATAGPLAASVIVTERYDRETLMVLGIEDDDMALRMMALQIVVDHQIFTGRDARRWRRAS